MEKYDPYPGLRAFDESESDRFFGRDNESRQILSRMFAHSEVLLYAPSGGGKTSLVNAKLIPELRNANFKVLPHASVGGPIEPIKDADNVYVANILRNWNISETSGMILTKMTLLDYMQATYPDDEPIAIILDHFEDLFTFYPLHSGHRLDFFKQVAAVLRKYRRLRILFIMREEFVTKLKPYYTQYLPEQLRTRFELEPLRHDAALDAIKKPVIKAGKEYAEGVAESIVDKLLEIKVHYEIDDSEDRRGEFVEPVQLQVVCARIWKNLPEDVQTITHIHTKSGATIEEALIGFYESVIRATQSTYDVSELKLRQWFQRHMITSVRTAGTVVLGTRAADTLSNEIVRFMQEKRLLRTEIRSGAEWVQLIHDLFVDVIIKSNTKWFIERRNRNAILALSAFLLISLAIMAIINSLTVQEQRIAIEATAQQQRSDLEAQQNYFQTRSAGIGGFPATLPPPDSKFFTTATAQAIQAMWTPTVVSVAWGENSENTMDFVYVPEGCYWVGNQAGESDESPIFEYCIETPFLIGKTEVTNAEFTASGIIASDIDDGWSESEQPRTSITWLKAAQFCDTLDPKTDGVLLDGRGRLPSEFEWEYAARGVNSLLYPWGQRFESKLAIYAPDNNSFSVADAVTATATGIQIPAVPERVGAIVENASWVGSLDMSGNVWEWTMSFYDETVFPYPYYTSTPYMRDANNDNLNGLRVIRGGAYDSSAILLRTSNRIGANPLEYYNNVGFRCAISIREN